jgi:membrane protease subunit (stomatin/prohibitin family)
MAIIDVVKWDPETHKAKSSEPMDEIYAWKYPSTELSTWTQLIVHESQEATLFRGGSMDGPFGPGRHVLKTENIPVIGKILNLPFGRSPFTAEVWFTNRAIPLDVKWGTQPPISLLDPVFNIAVPITAHGQYAVQIEHSRKFLVKLVGTMPVFTREKLREYFRGVILTIAKTTIAKKIVENGVTGGKSVLHIATELMTLSDAIKEELEKTLSDFGLRLVNFYVSHIDVQEDDPSIKKLREALAKRAEMNIVGYNYQQERSFNAIEGATGFTGAAGNTLNNYQNNPSDSGSNITGSMIGLGVGMGVGLPLGQSVGNQFSGLTQQSMNTGLAQAPTNMQPASSAPNSPMDSQRLQILRDLANLKASGILSEEEFEKEKRKILGA